MSSQKGKQKVSLRHLSRERASGQEHDAMVDEMARAASSNQPIVVAMLATAMVEHQLDDVLLGRLSRNDERTWDLLTTGGGPLSSFNSKIALGYALGCYDEAFKDNLDSIRRIRNAFAHAKKLIALDHPAIIAELRNLKLPTNQNRKLYRIVTKVRNLDDGPVIAFDLSP